MACDICKIIERKDEFQIIYEDDVCFALLHESPASSGHVMVIPKKHATILEELNDNDVGHLFNIANAISTIIFEVAGAQGTNIIMNNGVSAGQKQPHVILNIIPRMENDNLHLTWEPRQAIDSELKRVKSMLESEANFILSGKENEVQKNIERRRAEKTEKEKEEHKQERKKEDKKEPETDYRIDALRRTP